MFTKQILKVVVLTIAVQMVLSCSLGSLSVRLSSVFIENRMASLNRETDLKKVRLEFPENIRQLESLLAMDTSNKALHIYLAQAYYSYAFAFIEDREPQQAVALYFKAYQHALQVLEIDGLSAPVLSGRTAELRAQVGELPAESLAGLYWSALSWAKLIETQQPNLLLLTQLHKAAILMERVLQLDDTYHYAGPHLFFAVYYASSSGFSGENTKRARNHFERARKFNQSRSLMVDFLQIKYLGQEDNNKAPGLRKIIDAPDDLFPEQALMNAVAKFKASRLLSVTQNQVQAYNSSDLSDGM